MFFFFFLLCKIEKSIYFKFLLFLLKRAPPLLIFFLFVNVDMLFCHMPLPEHIEHSITGFLPVHSPSDRLVRACWLLTGDAVLRAHLSDCSNLSCLDRRLLAVSGRLVSSPNSRDSVTRFSPLVFLKNEETFR